MFCPEKMENNGKKSRSNGNQHSKGSKSTAAEKKSTEGSNSEPVFVNRAEIAWHQIRKEWTGDQSQKSKKIPREPIMSWTTTYEDLLLSTAPFQQPIPLTEMVDFLVDIWQEEGFYE